VKTGSLEVREGAQIIASTFGNGDGGELSVEADSMLLSGTGANGFPSGLFASAERGSSGDAGDLILNTNTLKVSDEATISARTFGPGRGGNLTISATDIELSNGGSIAAESLSPNPDAGQSGKIVIRASTPAEKFIYTSRRQRLVCIGPLERLGHGIRISRQEY
jgi:large exoprotein involved in heme utilization and adhesion